MNKLVLYLFFFLFKIEPIIRYKYSRLLKYHDAFDKCCGKRKEYNIEMIAYILDLNLSINEKNVMVGEVFSLHLIDSKLTC